MDKINLFEIVVYPSNEEDYYKKWDQKKNKFIEHQLATGEESKEEALNSFKIAYKNVYNYGYNKLCGLISIYLDISSGDVKFEIYRQKRNKYNKRVTLRLEQIYGPSLHDYIRNKNNREIISVIDKKLNYIKESFFKNDYIDLTCYNNIKQYVDFVEIIKNNKNINI